MLDGDSWWLVSGLSPDDRNRIRNQSDNQIRFRIRRHFKLRNSKFTPARELSSSSCSRHWRLVRWKSISHLRHSIPFVGIPGIGFYRSSYWLVASSILDWQSMALLRSGKPVKLGKPNHWFVINARLKGLDAKDNQIDLAQLRWWSAEVWKLSTKKHTRFCSEIRWLLIEVSQLFL